MKHLLPFGCSVWIACVAFACNSTSMSTSAAVGAQTSSATPSSLVKGQTAHLTSITAGAVGAGGLSLAAGQSMTSGAVSLYMQSAGNLVLYRGSTALWATNWVLGQGIPSGGANGGLSNCTSCSALFQGDGNLVLYNGSTAYWASGTSGNPGAVLSISNAAPYLSITSASGALLWAPISTNTQFSIPAGQSMTFGDLVLVMQEAGNLVLYRGGTPLWATNWFLGQSIPAYSANGNFSSCPACYAVFQGDGNLVLYNGNTPYWSAGTGGFYGAVFNISESAPYLSILTPQGSMLFNAGQVNSPYAPLVVTSSSSVVVMEYEAWFTPYHPLGLIPHAYIPTLTSTDMASIGSPGYDSEDPNVIAQQMGWIQAMGVNAITAEQTNGGPCVNAYSNSSLCQQYLARIGAASTNQADYTNVITSIDDSTFNLYPALASNGTNIKIIPLLDGQDQEMYVEFQQPWATGQATALDNQLQAYLNYMRQYPQLNVIYEGKPLVMVYLGAAQQPGVANSVLTLAQNWSGKYDGQLTIRFMASDVGSQPALINAVGAFGLQHVNPQYQTWSWLERLNSAAGLLPSYTSAGSRTEAFTVSSATPGTIVTNGDGGWNSPDAGLYNGGATFGQFMQYAQALRPIFLFVDQWNEYAEPDQGIDENHSNDTEPNQQWGYGKYNTVKAGLLSYENVEGQYFAVYP